MKVVFRLQIPIIPLSWEVLSKKIVQLIAEEEDKRFLALLTEELKKKK